MIKQLLTSGSGKEAHVGATDAQKSGENEAAAKSGLFGSILETVQSFGQNFQNETSADANAQQSGKNHGTEEEALVAASQESSVMQHAEPRQPVLQLTVQKIENIADEESVVAEGTESALQSSEDGAVIRSLQEVQQVEGEAEKNSIGLNPDILKEGVPETDTAEESESASLADNLILEEGEEAEAGMLSKAELEPGSKEKSVNAQSSGKESVFTGKNESNVNESGKEQQIIGSPQTDTAGEQTKEVNRVFDQVSTASGRLRSGDDAEPVEGKMAQANRASKSNVKADVKSAEMPEEQPVDKSGSPQKVAEPAELHKGVYAQRVEEKTEKKFKERYGSEGRLKVAEERLSPLETSGGRNAEESAFRKFNVMGDFSKAYQSNASGNGLNIEEWKLKQVSEKQVEMPESKEQLAINMARLTDIPVANTMLRREIMPRMAQAVQKSASAGKAGSQSWQKHNFELDDGNNVRLSTRQMDGVLQVKIGSSNVELTRLMQEYEQEIKQYLEQECELNVDLQFTGNEQGQEMSNFFGESGSSQGSDGMRRMGSSEAKKASAEPAKNMNNEAVRKFGYNQMEWTA